LSLPASVARPKTAGTGDVAVQGCFVCRTVELQPNDYQKRFASPGG